VPDPGSTGSASADLAALPKEIATQSLSSLVVILPREPALAAITHLAQNGRRLISWEGWVKFRDGTRAKSLSHGGSFALPRDKAKAAEVASAAIEKTQRLWDRNPEYEGTTLYYGLTFGD